MPERLEETYAVNLGNLLLELIACAHDAYTDLVAARADMHSLSAVGITAVHWESGGPVELQLCLLPNVGTIEYANV